MDITFTKDNMGVARGCQGSGTSDGTVITATLGFKPKLVMFVNLTDATKIEKIDGMTDAQTLQTVTAGTQTVQTGSQIVLTENGFTVSAAAAGTGKNFAFFAQ